MPGATEIDELWHELYARPDDDGVRAVLADLLIAAGDPRGELMALQLLPAEDQAARARQQRIQQLLAQHGRSWLGALDRLAIAARFDRGCVQALVVEQPVNSVPWPAVLAERALATVEELVGYGSAYDRLLECPQLGRLRAIELALDSTAAKLEACPAPLAHLAWRFDAERDRALLERHVFPACKQRESIVSLGFAEPGFDLVALQPWFARLRSVTVAAGARRGLALWRRLPPACGLVVTTQPGLEPCTVAFPYDYRIALERTPDGVVARIAGEWLMHPIDALRDLPREVARIEVEHTSDAIAARVREIVARPGVEVLVRAPRRAGNLNDTRRAT